MKAVGNIIFRRALEILIESKDKSIRISVEKLSSPILLKNFGRIKVGDNRLSFYRRGEQKKCFHLKNIKYPSKVLNYIKNRVDAGEKDITIPNNMFLSMDETKIEGDFGTNFTNLGKKLGTDDAVKAAFALFGLSFKEMRQIGNGEMPPRLAEIPFYDYCAKKLGVPESYKGEAKVFWRKLGKK